MSEANAPGGLDLVIDFVNTLDVEAGEESLGTPRELGEWLAGRELDELGDQPSDSDHRHAIDLREALRALMLANNGGAAGERLAGELELAARRGELAVRFAADGSVSLSPGVGGVSGALARILAPVADAMRDGSWQRVKACRADSCHWAFYDRSRNRSGVWCDMAICGNRSKVRNYRESRGGSA